MKNYSKIFFFNMKNCDVYMKFLVFYICFGDIFICDKLKCDM